MFVSLSIVIEKVWRCQAAARVLSNLKHSANSAFTVPSRAHGHASIILL
jgi:hypothetical protein